MLFFYCKISAKHINFIIKAMYIHLEITEHRQKWERKVPRIRGQSPVTCGVFHCWGFLMYFLGIYQAYML